MSHTIGTARALAIRPVRSSPPLRVDALHALAGIGLGGDVHADRASPRQVLLASRDVYAQLALPDHALHENLLVDVDTARLESGTVLQVGGEVVLRVMFQCESCGQLDRQHDGLSRMLGQRRGVLARVLAGGTIRPGDRIRHLGPQMPGWSDDWRERVVRILDAVPDGVVVEYGLLARLAGVQPAYCRALPGMLSRLGERYAQRAVSMRSSVPGVRWDGAGLFDDAACMPPVGAPMSGA
jgi:MOSC domain-containing protein YiiM